MRIDQLLVARKFCVSRAQAQDAVKAERVKVNGKTIIKCSQDFDENADIEVSVAELAFASRAGLKLYHALMDFELSVKDRIVLDVGASTGGFTDVCLSQGAAHVYACDVGSGQLIDKLRQNPRVSNMENINCRYLEAKMFDPLPDFVCMDVSFISILSIMPAVLSCLKPEYEMVLLIKPQFEAGKKDIGKNGIVKDLKVHQRVLMQTIDGLLQLKIYPQRLAKSKVCGRDGNQEYVVYCSSTPSHKVFDYQKVVKS